MNKTTQFHVWYWVAAFALLTAFQYFYAGSTQIEQIPYSQFETELQAGKIAEVAVSDQYIQGKYKSPGDGKPMFITTRVEPGLAKELQAQGVVVSGEVQSNFLSELLSWVAPTALFFGVWIFMLRRMGQGGIGG
ncbi:MAG: ATP-dependent metallopeptidase FtsH/Yme1/Tma family protein, partial [Pseudodonghicola sp.]